MALLRTWDYGTVKHGTAKGVIARGVHTAVVFEADDAPGEAFVLVGQKELDKVAEGERGTITFTRGGPTGGWWRYRTTPAPTRTEASR